MPVFNASTSGEGMRFAVISSRYNDFITEKLVRGARECLLENGVAEEDIDVFWCPGAMEIPAVAARAMEGATDQCPYDGIVCCGCVIRGETDHYTFVATEAIRGVAELAILAEAAFGNAILTVDNTQQAIERSGDRANNKGWEAASAALEVANLFRQMD